MLFGAAEPDWLQFTAVDVVDFIRIKVASVKTSLSVTATRALLRFFATIGDVFLGFEGVVPTVRWWKHASLSRYLTDDAVKAVLASCDETTAIGVRDRAILLLLVRLGLRAAEVTALALDDIDWRGGYLLVRRVKFRRERSLPLFYDVGQAIVAYPEMRTFLHAMPRCLSASTSALRATGGAGRERCRTTSPRAGRPVRGASRRPCAAPHSRNADGPAGRVAQAGG
jgi:integrase